MESRSASRAFFSTFRAWNLACRSRRLHTSKARHSRIPRSTSRHAGASKLYLSKRWASSDYGGLAKEVLGTESMHDLSAEPEDHRLHFDPKLLHKYPELELPKFLGILQQNKKHLLAEGSRRERSASYALKDLMRSMPHSTVLITTLANEELKVDHQLRKAQNLSPYAKHFRGAIVSSMTSVTLGPPAVISFNFKEPSATLDGIRKHRFFSVHFLKSDAEGAHVASSFLKHPGDHLAAWKAISKNHEITVSKKSKHDRRQVYAEQKAATPMIEGPGVISHLVCEIMLEKCVTGIGDHTIVVAKVVSPALYQKSDAALHEKFPDGLPPLLLYSEGRFREHGQPVEKLPSVEMKGEDEVAMRRAEDGEHPDLRSRRKLLDASEPPLYRAALNYLFDALTDHKRSKHYPALQRFNTIMCGSSDRRAKFVAALKFWQLGQMDRSRVTPPLDAGRPVISDAQAINLILEDARLREIAEELVRISVTEEIGPEAASLIGRLTHIQDRKRLSSQKPSVANSTSVERRERNAHSGSRSVVISDDSEISGHFEGEQDLGFDVSIEDALAKAQADLKMLDDSVSKEEVERRTTA